MADEVDDANMLMEQHLAIAVMNASLNAGPKLLPRGNCHYCETKFEAHSVNKEGQDVDENNIPIEAKLFCDKDCADDHAKEERLRNRR